jgi:hypothetical protein
MAFTHSNNAGLAAFDPAPPVRQNSRPVDALAQLPRLHAEAHANLALGGFVARSSQACIALMVAGGVALAWCGGASLKADFGWAALLLIGIVAMTRNVIRGHARSLRRVPLQEAAADLRVLLLYTGMAWGVGAFLVMPDLPPPALVVSFALAPSLALALILRDNKGIAAFVLPVTLLTAAATLMGAWPLDLPVAMAVLVCGLCVMLLPMVRCAMQKRRNAMI